ncbi:hypothetical protein NY10_469 [Carnobacterium antarcticum]|nr:hypothetical protein NY10_469 [Carnobacterium sp. CP1]
MKLYAAFFYFIFFSYLSFLRSFEKQKNIHPLLMGECFLHRFKFSIYL